MKKVTLRETSYTPIPIPYDPWNGRTSEPFYPIICVDEGTFRVNYDNIRYT